MAQSLRYHVERIRAARKQFKDMLAVCDHDGSEFEEIEELRRVAYAANHLADCISDMLREDGKV